MRFNESETLLVLELLKKIPINQITQANLDLVIEKLKTNQYIKGRLLQFLFSEINKIYSKQNYSNDTKIEQLLKSIKFKATPR